MADWSNWARTAHADGIDIQAPTDADHVRAILAEATAQGKRVKPIGAGHSFTSIGQPVDIQLDMSRLSGVISVDDRQRAWVRAGTRLADAVIALHERGLGLINQGDYDQQTLSGATSTGTHGTGIRFTGFAGAVRGVELALANGELLRVTDTDNAELLPALSLTLGALGVVTALEYQCEPAYLLTCTEEPMPLERVLSEVDGLVDGNDHFEFFWFPQTEQVLAKTMQRHRDHNSRAPLPSWRERLDDHILSNTLYRGVNEVTTRVPRMSAPLNRISARALGARSYTDWSHIVYPTERSVRFRESEFAVPRASVVPVLRSLDAWLRAHPSITSFPLEIRFAAPDDRWLSTAYDRPSAYIAVHQYYKRPYDEYFQAFWAIVREHAGRPHWGKMHELGAEQLRELYPRFDDFVALRDRLDPQRTFGNPYLKRVLGS